MAFLLSILQLAVSVGTMQLRLSIAVMQVPTFVAIMQVLRFYCNYVGGTFCYSYAGGSFGCNFSRNVTVSVAIMQLKVSFMQMKLFAANIWVTTFIEIMHVGVSAPIVQMVFSALCT